jgi:hypothetical protein
LKQTTSATTSATPTGIIEGCRAAAAASDNERSYVGRVRWDSPATFSWEISSWKGDNNVATYRGSALLYILKDNR